MVSTFVSVFNVLRYYKKKLYVLSTFVVAYGIIFSLIIPTDYIRFYLIYAKTCFFWHLYEPSVIKRIISSHLLHRT